MESKKTIWLAVSVSVLLIALPPAAYHYFHSEWVIAPGPEHWGQFGDFFGGLLNPVFSFLAFMGLLYTIFLQSKELSLAREANQRQSDELALAQETRDAALATQKEQNQLIARQQQDLRRRQNLDDLDKAIRLQAEEIETLLDNTELGYSYRKLILQLRLSSQNVSGDYLELRNAKNNKMILRTADLLVGLLYRLGQLLRTYDELNTPEESPTGSHVWYYTNSWRFRFDSSVKDIQILSGIHSEIDGVHDDFRELFNAQDPL